MNWLRYGKARRLIVLLAGRLPHCWLRARLLDFLYPLDARIRFE
jgi:hypothetical protein